MSSERDATALKDLLRIAKLDDSYSVGPIQTVSFSSTFHSDDYRIFEVDDALAELLLQSDGNCTAELKDEPKSNTTGRVFLCTPDESLSVVEAETSNSLLFISDWWLPNSTSNERDCPPSTVLNTTVQLSKSSYYELHQSVSPSLRLLKQILRKSAYQGPVEDSLDSDPEEPSNPIKYYSLAELEAKFPCSPVQLKNALFRLRACELRGSIRLMEVEYLNQVIRDIFACADENSWPWRTKGFPVAQLLTELADTHDPHLMKQIIPMFFRPRSTCSTEDGSQCLFPRNSSICQLIGEHLLSVTSSFNLTDFLAVWRAAVPEGLRPKLRKYLTCAGRAFSQPYISSSSAQNFRAFDLDSTQFRSISLLCSEDLPDESVEARLTALFQHCSIWPEAELASYIGELLPSSDNRTKSDDQHYEMESESDFEYLDAVDLDETAGSSSSKDVPKPVHPSVGLILNKLCRVNTTNWGRFYTEKHTQN